MAVSHQSRSLEVWKSVDQEKDRRRVGGEGGERGEVQTSRRKEKRRRVEGELVVELEGEERSVDLQTFRCFTC
jgi:hypothetical protein